MVFTRRRGVHFSQPKCARPHMARTRVSMRAPEWRRAMKGEDAMQAAFYEQTGPAAQVLRLGEVVHPQPGPHEVRLRPCRSGPKPSGVTTGAGQRNAVMPFPRVVPP